jgi:hypothetical protein
MWSDMKQVYTMMHGQKNIKLRNSQSSHDIYYFQPNQLIYYTYIFLVQVCNIYFRAGNQTKMTKPDE